MRGHERRTREKTEIHGIEIVTKVRERNFGRFDATGGGTAFENGDLPAFRRKMDCSGKAINAGSDHDCIESHALKISLSSSFMPLPEASIL